MSDVYQQAEHIGLVPVIVIDRVEDAVPLGKALIAGGLPIAEVTFRTQAGPEALARMAQLDGLLVGAGTVRSPEQVERAAAAGAQFVVTPGLSAPIVAACQDRGLPILPGVSSASDIHAATELGLQVLKFFPAQTSGGAPAIKALAAPFPEIRFMPTGGISPANLAEYLGVPSVIAAGGSWMVAPSLLREGRWDEVERLCREATALVSATRATA